MRISCSNIPGLDPLVYLFNVAIVIYDIVGDAKLIAKCLTISKAGQALKNKFTTPLLKGPERNGFFSVNFGTKQILCHLDKRVHDLL